MARIIAAFLFLFTARGVAQSVPCPNGSGDCQRLLLPIFLPQINGAFGATFVTSLSLYNRGTSPISVFGISPDCRIIVCGPPLGLPGRTVLTAFTRTGNPGALIYIPSSEEGDFAAVLRTQDITRQSQTWGTEIPVIRDSNFLSDPIALLDLPLDDRFRLALRVYGATPDSAEVRVRIFNNQTNTQINDFVMDLAAGADVYQPSYGSFFGFPRGSGIILPDPGQPPASTIRVEIEPVTPGLRYWAFVSVTNNETQHITVIAPH